MKVILKADIKGVGKKDQVINASDGYARNFLFPKNLAVEANAENMSKLKGMQDSKAFKKSQEKEEVTVCGNLCTAADLIGKNLVFPKAEIGDIIAITNAGSYGFTLSPILFSSHDIPYEIYLNSKNQAIISEY